MLSVQSPDSANAAKATSAVTAARRPPNRQTRSVPATVVPTHVSQMRSSVNQATSSSTKTRKPSKIVKTKLLSSAERWSISQTWNSSSLNCSEFHASELGHGYSRRRERYATHMPAATSAT